MSEINKYVYIGRIVSPHGLHGEVKVKVMTDNFKRFTKDFYVYLIKGDKISSNRIINIKLQGNFVILKLENIEEQILLSKKIANEGLSAKEAEKIAENKISAGFGAKK